jgi:hypothetical protein
VGWSFTEMRRDSGFIDGRVLREASIGGPDEEQIWVETRVLKTEVRRGHYQAAIQVSTVAHQRCIDKSWRMR